MPKSNRKDKPFRRNMRFRAGSTVECRDGSIYIVGRNGCVVGVVLEAQEGFDALTTMLLVENFPLRKIGDIKP